MLALIVLQSCGSGSGADKRATATPAALPSRNSAAFNGSFDQLLGSYYNLKDAFVEHDTARINSTSARLAADAGSLQLDQLKPDSSGAVKATALDYATTLKGAAADIAGQRDLQKKQRQFQTISDALYELARTVKYDRQKIYHQHCPMAFNDEGAYWISNSNRIVNPYMGKKHPTYRSAMLGCGDIPDSLNAK